MIDPDYKMDTDYYNSGCITITDNDYIISPTVAISGDIVLTSSAYPYNYSNNMAASGIAADIDLDYATHLQEYMEKEKIYKDYKIEESVRQNNAGVQAAWEQYKILVELAKLPPNSDQV